jgi:hypothetical protein
VTCWGRNILEGKVSLTATIEELHNSKKGFMKLNFIVRGMKHILGDGKRIRFWHEVWLDECTLRIKYEKLFNICNQQDWEVAKALEGG